MGELTEMTCFIGSRGTGKTRKLVDKCLYQCGMGKDVIFVTKNREIYLMENSFFEIKTSIDVDYILERNPDYLFIDEVEDMLRESGDSLQDVASKVQRIIHRFIENGIHVVFT